MTDRLDYKGLGLKCGIEIHQQLTGKKLFCACSSAMREKPKSEIVRRLRAVVGELGDVDVAAQYEALKGKVFVYKLYPGESCLVEMDEEPPHPINRQALETALQVALMLNCEIPDEIHIMRKTVLDGSNTTGFQRTAIIGLNGWVETAFGRVGITNVCLEEESCQILGKEEDRTIYGLSRLGIPLIEIGTAPDVTNPQQGEELASKLGMVLASTGRTKSGLGTIRQDLNISIAKGNRVEIKGVQSLSLIPKAIEEEVKRQYQLVLMGKKISPEVRRCLPDGRSEFLRPMPGAARMYPETDIPPIVIDKIFIEGLRMRLPELIDDKIKRFVRQYNLSREIAEQIVRSDRASLFEFLTQWADPRLVAGMLTTTLNSLKREGFEIEKLEQDHFVEIIKNIKEGRMAKEAIPDILKALIKNPQARIGDVIKQLNIQGLSEQQLRQIVRDIIKKKPELLKTQNPMQAYMGLVMAQVRGRISGRIVAEILRKELKG